MREWMLTDKEIKNIDIVFPRSPNKNESTEGWILRVILAIAGAVADAQAKKLVEWGMETCDDVGHSGAGYCRFDCTDCFNALRKGIGLDGE